MPVTVTVDHLAAVPEPLPDDALVAVGVRAGGLDEVDGLDPALAAAAGFTGEVAQTLVVSLADGLRLLVGLGADPDAASMRRAAVAAARAARAATVVVDALGSFEGAARRSAAEALAEGLVLGSYRFGAYKEAGDGVRPAAFSVVGKGGQAVGRAIERGVAVAAAITLVRDLVNTPGGDLTPVAFAAAATDVAADAGLAPSPDVAAAGRDLLARYREVGRHYHDGGHLLAVLRALDELAAPGPPSAALRLAAWYHDAVYDPTAAAGDNERRSAELAERGLARLGVAAPLVADVASLVRATATHRLDGIGAPLVAEAALFLDADLAVLGGTAAEYDRLLAAVEAVARSLEISQEETARRISDSLQSGL